MSEQRKGSGTSRKGSDAKNGDNEPTRKKSDGKGKLRRRASSSLKTTPSMENVESSPPKGLESVEIPEFEEDEAILSIDNQDEEETEISEMRLDSSILPLPSDLDPEEQEESSEEPRLAATLDEAEYDMDTIDSQPPFNLDPDDPDNIFMIHEDAAVIDDVQGVELLFMDTTAEPEVVQRIDTFPGVVGINISPATIDFLEMKDLTQSDPPHTYISFKRVKLHIYIFQESSEFYQYHDLLTHYPDFAILIGLDTANATGHSHFMCTTLEGRNMILNPPKLKKTFVDLKKKEDEVWEKLASIAPRKWRSLGSEIEVDLEFADTSRPLITMYAYRYIEQFNRPYEFTDTKIEGNEDALTGFPSIDPEKIPLLEVIEKDVAVQVMPTKTATSTQTGFSFKRNKICQYESQLLDPEGIKAILEKSAESVVKKTRGLQRALIQNEMLNLTLDDYKYTLNALKGHEIEYSEESVILEEYHTYSDVRHSKGRCVTWMTFHPTLDDVVVIAMAEDVTFDKRIDFHSKMLMEPNFVLFWDLKEPTHPQIMLDAPSDVFSFMINPSAPQLICGGCANGQVVLWDLGHEYVDLRARVQDRRRKSNDKGNNTYQFLDKLEDTTEKYICPLVAPVGLSNLDLSHKKVVTSVIWLPSHVELSRTGILHKNKNGKSVQFFSAAGEGDVRFWDIRPPKTVVEEEAPESLPSELIRSNAYLHLENNHWKYSVKFELEVDGVAILVNILSLSEPRQGDALAFETMIKAGGETAGSKDSSNLEVQNSTPISSQPLDLTSTSNEESQETTLDPLPVVAADTSLPTADEEAAEDEEEEEEEEGEEEEDDDDYDDEEQEDEEEDDGEEGMGDKSARLLAIRRRPRKKIVGKNIAVGAKSSIFVGSETGQVGLVDWFKDKEGEISLEGPRRVVYNVFLETIHDGAITSISRSPFHHNLILVIGGGTVSIWKETLNHPLWAVGGSEQFPWCGCWSNTRPAVFFVGTREGALQVWDLTEKGHAPVLLQPITPDRITNIAIPKAKVTKNQFLALSDSVGNLFVMLLSRFYYKPTTTENIFMTEFITREEKRLITWKLDLEPRTLKMEMIHNNWKESRVTKTSDEVAAIESELEARLKEEYAAYADFEETFASHLSQTAPQLSVSGLEVDVHFDELYKAAMDKQLAHRGSDEEEEEEEGEGSSTTSTVSLGSEFDFLKQARVSLATQGHDHESKGTDSPESKED